jgi:hypothetical protein
MQTEQPKKYMNKVTMKQDFAICDMIRNHGRVEPNKDGDRFFYNEGWDDARIAREMGVRPAVVKTRRVNIFGKFVVKKPKKEAAPATDNGTLAALTASIEAKFRAELDALHRAIRELKSETKSEIHALKSRTSMHDVRLITHDKGLKEIASGLGMEELHSQLIRPNSQAQR